MAWRRAMHWAASSIRLLVLEWMRLNEPEWKKSDIKVKFSHMFEEYQLGQRETNYTTSVLIFKSAHVVSPIKYAALLKLLNKCKFPKGIFRLCCDCVSWCFLCSLSSLLFDDSDQMDDAAGAENQPGEMINFTYTVVFISDSFSIFVCQFAGVSDWSLWQATGNLGRVLVFDLKKKILWQNLINEMWYTDYVTKKTYL